VSRDNCPGFTLARASAASRSDRLIHHRPLRRSAGIWPERTMAYSTRWRAEEPGRLEGDDEVVGRLRHDDMVVDARP
jgi:hypothetical protein